MSHNTLVNYFQTVFAMVQDFNFGLLEVESMIPWERDVYLELIEKRINESNDT